MWVIYIPSEEPGIYNIENETWDTFPGATPLCFDRALL